MNQTLLAENDEYIEVSPAHVIMEHIILIEKNVLISTISTKK